MMQPRRTVKELLVAAKDAAELMVDLAYAAVFFGDDSMAREVLRLEDRIDDSLDELRVTCMLAARTPADADALAGVLGLAMSIEGIADSAEDIARVQLKDIGVPPQLRDDLRYAEEVTGRIRIRDGNQLAGSSLRELELPARTGMWLIALRRDVDWVYGLDPEEVLRTGDVLFLQGPEEGMDALRELAGVPPRGVTEPTDDDRLTDLDRAVDLVVELKNVSEVAVGLAYAAILLRDRSLAAEVSAIEDASDDLFHGLEGWVLRAARDLEDPAALRGLLHIAAASERIVDSAQSMTRVIETDDAPHPIIAAALSETDEITADAFVAAGSALDGASLGDHQVHTNTGMEILAIDRGGHWIYRPRSRRAIRAGDRLLALGPEEGALRLRELAGDHRPEGDEGEWVMDPDESYDTEWALGDDDR
ncbi:potassium channel family protein [Salsipaludibacter albus]|uniref:potassium channel family protein n=1 Tax=Salsipaludibacter albus TaxID=2849650 RepID=UPI001EE3AB6F|nr:TrkA C-terminal domain-containing protein [Salsipaludibacter albus]MBY5164434.1 potassium channel protein [Salsipaludibacter albus]